MPLAPKQVGKVYSVTNLTASGAIGIAPATVDAARHVVLNQTTAGLTFTLPNPTDTSVSFTLTVTNVGTSAFTMYGVSVAAGTSRAFAWTSAGAAWTAVGVASALTYATVASLPTNLPVGTGAYASNCRCPTGVATLGGGFITELAGAGTGAPVRYKTVGGTTGWYVDGTTTPATQ